MQPRTRRNLGRSTAVTVAAGALVALGTVPASATPWVTWTVITDVSPGGVVAARVATGTPGPNPPAALSALGRAIGADASDNGRVAAYTTQTRVRGRDAARVGLTVVVRGSARVVLVAGASGRPDVSADGATVTVGRSDGSVMRYDVARRTLTTLCRRCTGIDPAVIPGRVGNVALSPDRRYVAVWGTSDGDAEALSIWRTADGRRMALRTWGESEPDDTLAWTANSRQLGYVTQPTTSGAAGPGWVIALLGVDGRSTLTKVTSPSGTRLSGPMRLGSTWWFVRTAGYSPTSRSATLLRTTSLGTPAAAVGSVRTWAGTGTPFTGRWTVTAARPLPLP